MGTADDGQAVGIMLSSISAFSESDIAYNQCCFRHRLLRMKSLAGCLGIMGTYAEGQIVGVLLSSISTFIISLVCLHVTTVVSYHYWSQVKGAAGDLGVLETDDKGHATYLGTSSRLQVCGNRVLLWH